MLWWNATQVQAAYEKIVTKKSRYYKKLLLHLALLLLLLTLSGCAIINRFIFTAKKEISATPAKQGIPFREVWFHAHDGFHLNGWLIDGTSGYPLILFFHGNAGNLSDNLEYIKLLHSRGFPIFIFDYRGYGKSGGEPLEENDLYQDGRSALLYLEQHGWRHERMIFFGQSLGAAVALETALDSPPAGLVMESSFTCFNDIIKYLSPLGYYTVAWWGVDLSFDNLAKIGDVGVPLLLIHGAKDDVVPMEMTLQLFAQATEPKMLHIISEGGHCDVSMIDRRAYIAAWNRYMKTLSIMSHASKGTRQ